MTRRVFYSFHYQNDAFRAAKIRNIRALEGNPPATDNDWEEVTRGGDAAIARWINSQLTGRSCVVVLIGSATAGRKWIDYEIREGWNAGKGLLGIHIHRILNHNHLQSAKGPNPFAGFTVGESKSPLDSIVRTVDPPYLASADAYGYIAANIASWIEEAITIRGRY